MKYFFIGALIFMTSLLSAKEDVVYVGAIFQNEERFLAEWVQFHLDQGIDKIYMYNNKSEDASVAVLQQYIDQGDVILIDWDKPNDTQANWSKTQCSAYDDCLMRCIDKCDWIAFIDTDEFLFSPEGRKIGSVMCDYEDCGSVGVNWVFYGTSNVEHIPEGQKIVDHLVYRSEFSFQDNSFIKSIVRPRAVRGCVDPHYFLLKKGEIAVSENRERIKLSKSPFSANKLRINHYWSRDRDFFENVKLARCKRKGQAAIDAWIEYEKNMNLVYDPILARPQKENLPRQAENNS